ncbi:replication endonuclease [Yersinia enterocolitica]
MWRLRNDWRESQLRAAGLIHKRAAPYISKEALADWIEQKCRNREFFKRHELIDDEGNTVSLEAMVEGCEQQRIARGPYERAEYLIGLLRQDNKLLRKQLDELKKGSCKRCGDTLPGDKAGCCLQGDTECWQTQGYKKLMLDSL